MSNGSIQLGGAGSLALIYLFIVLAVNMYREELYIEFAHKDLPTTILYYTGVLVFDLLRKNDIIWYARGVVALVLVVGGIIIHYNLFSNQ